jgi:hypothetical protein
MKVAVLMFLSAVAGLRSADAQQVAGPHPSYLHALSDLRYARAYLDHGRPGERQSPWEHEAVGQIDQAIGEIKHAAIDDGKNLGDHPPIDTNLYPADRFREAEKLLGKAHHDLDHAEDVQQARGLRDAALMHIDKAWHAAQDALNHGVR